MAEGIKLEPTTEETKKNVQLTPRTLAGLDVRKVEERSTFFNILIYGDSGVGKTTLAGSASMVPEMYPVLVIDIEGGTESLKHSYPDVDMVRVTDWDDMQNVYNELYLGKTGYKTVILDSLTEIQKFNMYAVMKKALEKHPNMEPDVPGMREWGINLEQVRKMVRGFRDLDMHTIFTALAKSEKNDKTGVTTTMPSLSGKMKDEVAAFLDIVVYYYVKQVGTKDAIEFQRFLLTTKTEQFIAKDRSGKLPPLVESPTMQTIFNLMTQYKSETTNTTNTKEK